MTSPLAPQQYVEVIGAETDALVAAALDAGLDAAVPSCPGWSVADLLGHVGRVQRWAAGVLEERVTTPPPFPDDERPPAADLGDWVREGATRLVAAAAATPPDTAVWTFPGPGEARFWLRRQVHEVVLHRVDAELAAGATPVVDGEIARDGIDEFLDLVVAFRRRDRLTGAGETVHLHRTDGEGEWLVRCTPDGPEVERTHAKGDVAARGSATDLLLALRGRAGIDSLEVFGDAALLASFIDRSRI